MAMSVKVFDSLTNKDFQNGAIRDEIRRSLRELERVSEYVEQKHLQNDDSLTEYWVYCPKCFKKIKFLANEACGCD